VTATERIDQLKMALAGAEAVQAEIERRNREDANPFRRKQRAPLLERAIIEVRDTRKMIRDLEATLVGVELDESAVTKLDESAARLDAAIRANALVDVAMSSLEVTLNSVVDVRTTLA